MFQIVSEIILVNFAKGSRITSIIGSKVMSLHNYNGELDWDDLGSSISKQGFLMLSQFRRYQQFPLIQPSRNFQVPSEPGH